MILLHCLACLLVFFFFLLLVLVRYCPFPFKGWAFLLGISFMSSYLNTNKSQAFLVSWHFQCVWDNFGNMSKRVLQLSWKAMLMYCLTICRFLLSCGMVCLNRLQKSCNTYTVLHTKHLGKQWDHCQPGSVIIHVQEWVPIIFYLYCSLWFLKIPGPSRVEDADHKHPPKAKRDALMLISLYFSAGGVDVLVRYQHTVCVTCCTSR